MKVLNLNLALMLHFSVHYADKPQHDFKILHCSNMDKEALGFDKSDGSRLADSHLILPINPLSYYIRFQYLCLALQRQSLFDD